LALAEVCDKLPSFGLDLAKISVAKSQLGGVRLAGWYEWTATLTLDVKQVEAWQKEMETAGSDDLNAAWAIWRSWEAASGCKLGVAGKDKTVVAVGRWKNYKMVKGEAPLLKLADGSCVPCIGPDEIYKHVGIPRTADGDGAAARRKIRSLFHVFVERLTQLCHGDVPKNDISHDPDVY
jgi:hypothetical protein